MRGCWGFGGGGFEGKRKEKKVEREAMDGSGCEFSLQLMRSFSLFVRPKIFCVRKFVNWRHLSMESSPLSLQLVDKFRNPLICLLFFHFVHKKNVGKTFLVVF